MAAPEIQSSYPTDSLYLPLRGEARNARLITEYVASILPIEPLVQPVAVALSQRETFGFQKATNRAGISAPSISDFVETELRGVTRDKAIRLSMRNFITMRNPSDLSDERWYAGYDLVLGVPDVKDAQLPRQLQLRSLLCAMIGPYLEQINDKDRDVVTLKNERPMLLIGTISEQARIRANSLRNVLHARSAREGKGAGRITVGSLQRYQTYGMPPIQ
jgi:hypothetical protein